MKKNIFLLMLAFCISIFLTACSDNSKTFTVLSGSENKPFESMLTEYAKENGYKLQMVYKGSIDSMLELERNPNQYDAIWLPNSMWINMGDSKKMVKYDKSIYTSPVVFGIKQSKAEELVFTNKEVHVEDILQAVKQKKLSFMMTSASQSNSGASAYMGFLYAFLGNPNQITVENLHDATLKENMKDLLSGVNRSSESSGWLKDLYLKGNYDAMVNYESVIIETNQELVKKGKEPLYVVYPKNGLTMADNTLGYIDNKDSEKEKFFKSMQNLLLEEKTQSKIADLGRRTGLGGVMKNANQTVFNPKWGIQTEKTLSSIPFPSEHVIQEALKLYQTDYKKPSYTVFALDYSGSMNEDGEKEMKEAISLLLDQKKAKQYVLQSSNEDKVVVIPFSDKILKTWKANDLSQYDNLLQSVQKLEPNGGTNIYDPSIEGLRLLKDIDMEKYNPAIILMTDGNSSGNINELKKYYTSIDKDIPIFSIMFGDASDKQLNEISDITRGRTFDGKKNLISAFKNAKGYN